MLPLKAFERTLLYSILHFVVDGICACVIFSYLYNEEYTICWIVFLTYNCLAFLGQPFVGLLIDRWQNPKLFLLISILFLSFGYFFHFQFILSAICLGIGNSFFHVCGGKDVTCRTKNDIVSLGIFVSTGAIGLMLGQNYHSNILLGVFYGILFVISGVLLLSNEETPLEDRSREKTSPFPFSVLWIGVLCFVVAIRSFVGKIIILDFEVSSWIIIGIAIATALGKMVGGFSAKYIGRTKTILLSMILAIPCLCIWNTNPVSICIGIFVFNFSMPITLYYANTYFKKREGLAFGLLAAALIPGYFLGMLEYPRLAIQYSIISLSILSIVCIWLVERNLRKWN